MVASAVLSRKGHDDHESTKSSSMFCYLDHGRMAFASAKDTQDVVDLTPPPKHGWKRHMAGFAGNGRQKIRLKLREVYMI